MNNVSAQQLLLLLRAAQHPSPPGHHRQVLQDRRDRCEAACLVVMQGLLLAQHGHALLQQPRAMESPCEERKRHTGGHGHPQQDKAVVGSVKHD